MSVRQAGELCLLRQEAGGKSVGHSEREGWGKRCLESLCGSQRCLDGRDGGLHWLPWMMLESVALHFSQSMPAGGFSDLSAWPRGVTDHLKHCFAFSAWTSLFFPTGKSIFHQCGA